MYMYVYMYAKHMTNICGPIGLKMWLLPLWVHFQPQAYAEFFLFIFGFWERSKILPNMDQVLSTIFFLLRGFYPLVN